MDLITRVLWVIALGSAAVSVAKDRGKTFAAMKRSQGMMKGMVGEIIAVIFIIGLLLTFVPPEAIRASLSDSNSVIATTVAALVGSITLIPAFVAFPLVGSIISMGASIVPAVAFLTTLTMVGVLTFPLERQEFGLKFALVRNGLSFIFALAIAFAMGVWL